MWTFIPSESCPSVPVWPCSTSGSAPDLSTLEYHPGLWATVSGMPSRKPFSWLGWRKRPWSRRLFQTISKISTSGGADALIGWWLDSLASPGASRVRDSASTTNAGYGPLSHESSVECNLQWCSSKMSGALFPGVDSIEFSTTLPRSGSMRNGRVSRQPPLALRTSGKESSSSHIWPTPNSFDAHKPEETTEQYHARNAKKKAQNPNLGAVQWSLTHATLNWPTPLAEDSESCGNHPEATDSLTGAVGLWTTPIAHDARKRSAGQTSGKLSNGAGNACLATEVELWATLNAMAGGSVSRGGERVNEPLFAGQAQQWPTPNARDHKGSDLPSRNGGASLGHATETGVFSHSSRPAPATETDGEECSPKVPGSLPPSARKRLNPCFVEFLMGLPTFWTMPIPLTHFERTGSGAEGMDASLWRQRLLSAISSFVQDY